VGPGAGGATSDEADVEELNEGAALDLAVIESFRQPMSLNIS